MGHTQRVGLPFDIFVLLFRVYTYLYPFCLLKIVPIGIEPMTLRLSGVRSDQLS